MTADAVSRPAVFRCDVPGCGAFATHFQGLPGTPLPDRAKGCARHKPWDAGLDTSRREVSPRSADDDLRPPAAGSQGALF